MPLSLSGDDTIERKPLLDLSAEAGPSQTSEFQDSQAAKLHAALGPDSPGLDTVAQSMTASNADSYRRILAERSQIQQAQTQNDILDSVLQADPKAVTPEVVDVVQGLTQVQMQSPDLSDIIEKEYAKRFVNTGVSTLENGVVEDSLAADPEKTYELMDRAETFAYKSNYLNTILDQAQKQVDDQSWLGTVYNLGENMVVGNYQTYNQVQSAAPDDLNLSVLPGMNRQEGYAFLWSLQDTAEFKQYMDQIRDDLSSRNPYAFRDWFQGMVSFGNDEAALNTITSGMDVASLIPVGKFGTALKGLSRAASMNPMKMSEIAGVVGKNLESGIGRAAEDIADGSFLGGIKNAKDLEKSVSNLHSVDKMMEGGTMLSRAAYGRFTEAILNHQELVRRILSTNTVDRLTPEEVIYLKDDLARQYMKDNPSIGKNVIDIEAPNSPDLGNVYNAKIIIGQRDGSLFESEKQAQNYFRRNLKLKTDDYQIVQKGDGFQIEINKTLNEEKLFDLKLDTNQQSPRSLTDFLPGKSGLSWLRSPVEQLSNQQNVARSVLTTSKEQIDHLFSEMTKPIGELSKKELSEMNDILFINQKGQKFYDNVGEFEQAFYDRFQKAPTEKQAEAYFAYTNVSDLDLVIRDLDWYKQKAARGFEDIDIDLKADRGPDQTEYWKQSFEGRIVDNLPYTDETPFKVGVIEDGRLKSVKFSATMNEGDRAKIAKLQEQGYKIINAVDSSFNIDGKYLDYVLAKNFKRSRVGVKNVDRKAGGHKIVRDPYYIKQGRVAGEGDYKLYRGDSTFFNARTEKEATEFVQTLEEARMKLLRQDADAVKFIRDNLPIPVREFMAAVADGSIDLNTPFTVTRSGQRAIDTAPYKAIDLRDLTRSSHKPGDAITGRFGGERAEADVSAIRSEGDTRWRIEGAPYLSPLEAMKTASSDMISTRLINDYKIMSLKNFIREFGDILDGTPRELRNQGFDVIQNPKFAPGAADRPEMAEKIQRAKNVSRAFNGLLDNSDQVSRALDLYKEKVLSNILPKFGPRGQEWLGDSLATRSKNPAARLKSMAFHFKMGMFNPTQFFKQANAAVNIVSVGGINGLKSSALYPLLRWGVRSSDLESLGKVAERVGLMKSQDFVESMKLYKNSGFNEIGGDVAFLDDLRSPELVRSQFGKKLDTVLKIDATPFMEGERMSRLAAWNTAYMEKKALKKGAALTRRDEADILYRAKTLIGNMTREANAPWQKGYASVITQFFGYQARIMDQMLGKQLTGAEKARLFTAYSMMYGLPVGIAAGTGVLPVREIVQKTLYEQGIDPNQPAVKPFVDGLAQSFQEFAFGKDWNIASSYGPGGVPTFYDMFRGDKTFADLLLGASGGIGADTVSSLLSSSWHGLQALWSESSDIQDGLYNLAAEDFVKALRNITTIDSAYKVYHVYNAGTWLSKNGYDIAKMDLPDAVMAALTGLTPGEMDRNFSKREAAKGLKEAREKAKFDLVKRLKDARRMESGRTREAIIKQIKTDMELWGFSGSEKMSISKWAWDSETLSDSSLEQYEKEMKRKFPDQYQNDNEGVQ